ncbi:hypothetical protein GMST_00910 [Geomonas silvestris]|uniref:Endonuclease/exonuclease/phosphatase domain-containing protein n=1 Tax=Geomonas silvestris TaxID=2740184 RepID=A0A6V8MCV2_9BACT|nr:hypothetical protein GMST_00910 [Geomonas silvestris]
MSPVVRASTIMTKPAFATCLLYAVFLCLTTWQYKAGLDLTWYGALVLYQPRLFWCLPGLVLVLLLYREPLLAVLPVLCVVWVLVPYMGLHWQTSLRQAVPGTQKIRVLTWNIDYGGYDKLAPLEIRDHLKLENPDVVLFQDAGGILKGPLGRHFDTLGWQARSFGQYVVASRYPVGDLEVRPIPFDNAMHTCVRTVVQVAGHPVVFYNVHLQTPRSRLAALLKTRNPRRLPLAMRGMERDMRGRFGQALLLKDYLGKEPGNAVLVGDLNVPDASSSADMLREAGVHDAFSESGCGYGFTFGHSLVEKWLGPYSFSWLRLDHIFLGPQVRALSCWVGASLASDHRPVVADLSFVWP